MTLPIPLSKPFQSLVEFRTMRGGPSQVSGIAEQVSVSLELFHVPVDESHLKMYKHEMQLIKTSSIN